MPVVRKRFRDVVQPRAVSLQRGLSVGQSPPDVVFGRVGIAGDALLPSPLRIIEGGRDFLSHLDGGDKGRKLVPSAARIEARLRQGVRHAVHFVP